MEPNQLSSPTISNPALSNPTDVTLLIEKAIFESGFTPESIDFILNRNTDPKDDEQVAKLPGNGKMDEDQIKIFDDLPSSAVELQVKDKFLRKLNRQERVVEEVKLVLKPHYNKKHISKDDYKEILRRAVPKICHSRSQEINPKKIQNLIEAYVKKFRQRNKLGILNTGQVSSAVKCAAYLKKL